MIFISNLFKDINYLLNILAVGLSGLLCKFSMKTSEHVLLISEYRATGFSSLKFTVEPFELILHHNTFCIISLQEMNVRHVFQEKNEFDQRIESLVTAQQIPASHAFFFKF